MPSSRLLKLSACVDEQQALLRVVPKAAKVDEIGVESNLSNGASGTPSTLAFDELTDIIR
jgi:hypothetical protein